MIEDFDVFTEQSQSNAKRAIEIALQHRHRIISESHVLLALLECPDEVLTKLFDFLAVDLPKLKDETYSVVKRQKKVPFWKSRNGQFFTTPTIKMMIENAVSISKQLGKEEVSSVHLFAGLVYASVKRYRTESKHNVARILIDSKITPENVIEGLKRIDAEYNAGKSS